VLQHTKKVCVEAPAVDETPVDEAAVEVVGDQEEADDAEEEEAEPKKELTDEEKIAELDKLSKAHPFGLLANLAKLSNKHRAVFAIAKNEKPEGADDSFEPSMSLTARFGEIKIVVPKVAGENFKFAKKVGADLLLKEMYGETHELDAESEAVKAAGLESCIKVKSLDQFVGILNAKKLEKQCALTIEGAVDSSKKAEVDALKAKIVEAAEPYKPEIKISCCMAQGDKMGIISPANKVMEEGTADVKHEAGQVLLLDFWATWCPPCQAPMAHN